MARFDTYRAPGSTGWRTTSLFADVCFPEQRDDAPYWLNRNKTGDSRKVMRDYFMEYEDLSGSRVANKLLGNIEHFNKMYAVSPWFKEAVDMWRMELRAILQARAMARVLEIMEESNPATSLAAAKFVVDKLSDNKKKPTRGRPSSIEVKGELKKAVEVVEATDEDWARITEHMN